MKHLIIVLITVFSTPGFGQESALYQPDSVYKVNKVKARLWYSGTEKDKELTKTTYYNQQGKLIKFQLEPTEEGTQVSTYYSYDSIGRFLSMIDTIRHENKKPAVEVAHYDLVFDGNTLVKLTKYNPNSSIDYVMQFTNKRKVETLYRYKNGTLIESYTTEYLSKHEERFYGWEKTGKRKSTWDYRFQYEYENGRVQGYIQFDGKKKADTAKLFYNDKGLLIKIDKYYTEFFEYVYY